MRLLVLSDLHFEFHRDDGRAFVESLDPHGVDVVVIAGDLAVGEGVSGALALLCQHFESSVVVYVQGNHELYGTSLPSLRAILQGATERNRNLRWLDCDATSIDGVRFLGAPLWFSRPPNVHVLKSAMQDFQQIEGLESWVYDENARARAFFDRELRAGDVVITHHLPTPASVAPQWRGSPLNAFFVCDVEALIRERAPAVWIHGHTHASVDTVVDRTRVVCNPFGYVRLEENAAFDERKIVSVGSES